MKRLQRLLLVSLVVPGVAFAQTTALLQDLVKTTGFTKQEIAELGSGALAKELDVPDSSRNAAFAGIIRIESVGSGFADALSTVDLASIPGAADAFGRFSDPAVSGDVAGIRFPDDDIEVLADCKLSACKFKLSRKGIDALATIDWNDANAGEVFTELFRKEVLRYVQAYRFDGASALVVYADKSKPQSLAETASSLVDRFPSFARHAPDLARYLVDYPKSPSPSTSDAIVWSIKDFGYRPTIAVDQIFMDRDPKVPGALALFAVKTIYVNHYLAGRVQLGAVLDGVSALGIPGHFILLIDQIRFDDKLNGFKRSLLGRGLVPDVESRLQLLRTLADGGK